MLARLRRGGDADDLAWPALKDQQVADAHVVAGDGDGAGWGATLDVAGAGGHGRGGFALVDLVLDRLLADVGGRGGVVVVSPVAVPSVDRVGDAFTQAVRGTVGAVPEGVVVPVVVVVTHVVTVFFG